MPLFGQRESQRRLQESGIPGLEQVAVSQGWQLVADEQPFGAQLEDDLREITWVLHGVPRSMMPPAGSPAAATVAFSDAYRGALNGKAVTFANAWTSVPSMSALPAAEGVAVCAVELSSVLDLLSVQPRSFPPVLQLRETPVGPPEFAGRFLVQATASAGRQEPAGRRLVEQVLTPDVQGLVMARDDWFLRISPYALVCITKGPFRSVAEVGQQVTEVLAVAAAIPSLIMSAPAIADVPVWARPEPGPPAPDSAPAGSGDHPIVLERIAAPDGRPPGGTDLAARLSRLGSMDEALEMLQGLTPPERAQLAGLETPLASLADVRTAEQAAARYRALSPQQKLQLAAMFMRPGGTARPRR